MKRLLLVPLLVSLLLAAGASALPAQQVSLPLPEYQTLRAKAFPPPEPPVEPPAPVAFEAAELEVTVGNTSARVTYALELSLYGEGWQSLPLPAAGSFLAADFGGLEGRLSEGESRSLLVRGRGRHRVTLRAVLPLERDETATRPTWRLRLDLPAAAVVTGTLTASEEVLEVKASGPMVVTPQGAGRWSFVGAPGEVTPLTLTGEATAPERSRLPLRFEVVSAAALTVSHTRLRLRTWVEARVLQGELTELELPLPPGFEVVAVEGQAVAGWDVEAGVLRVTPLVPVRDAFTLEMELAGAPAAELASPRVTPSGAARALIASKVAVEGDGLLTLVDAGAGRRPDAHQEERLPEAFQTASGEAFILPESAAPPRWQVTWAQGTQVLAAQVDRLLVHYLVGESGQAHLELWAAVRNTGGERLSLDLPAGAELLAARRDGVPLVPGQGTDGWAVPLAATSAPQTVYLSALVPVALPAADGELLLALPRLSAPASRVEVRAALPPGRVYELADGGRAGAAGPPPAAAAREETTALARQLLGKDAGSPPERSAPVGIPPGYRTLEASWSALSSTPPPLAVKVDRQRQRWEWQ